MLAAHTVTLNVAERRDASLTLSVAPTDAVRPPGAASPGLDSSFGSMPSLHGGGASRSLPELGAEGGGTDAWWVANVGGLSGENLEQDTLDQLQLAKTLRSLGDIGGFVGQSIGNIVDPEL